MNPPTYCLYLWDAEQEGWDIAVKGASRSRLRRALRAAYRRGYSPVSIYIERD